MDDDFTVDKLFRMFPKLQEINVQMPIVINKCYMISFSYVDKHYELLNLFDKYGKLLLKYTAIYEQYETIIINLRTIAEKISDNDAIDNLEELKREQQSIMQDYDSVVNKWSEKGIDFSNNYENIIFSIEDVIKDIVKSSSQINSMTPNTIQSKLDELNRSDHITMSSQTYISMYSDNTPPTGENKQKIVVFYPQVKKDDMDKDKDIYKYVSSIIEIDNKDLHDLVEEASRHTES